MKSIYDEAIEILLNMGAEFISVSCNPIGEENSDMIHLIDATETYEANMHEVVKALEQAQKQEKLLELYRELDDCIVAPNGHHVCRYTDDEKYARIRKQIKELENERNTKK
jgi:TnpA family transposase